MARHYCSYFDRRYLARGLAMIRSLRAFEPQSPIWVLCLDTECERLLTAIGEPGVRVVSLKEIEENDEPLARAKANRSRMEYYFTLTPTLIAFVMRSVAADDTVTYVDGDLFFFADPAPLHEELGRGAVLLVEHRFPDRLKHLEQYGRYNVGWLTFRNCPDGREIVTWWRERCNEWCYDVLEEDRFADQKYLDRFETLFTGVIVSRHDGANVAPWNVARYRLAKVGEALLVDQEVPLLFFHFHGVRQLTAWAYAARHGVYAAPFGGAIRRHLYRPYVATLAAIEREVAALGAPARLDDLARDDSARRSASRRLLAAARRAWFNLLPILRGDVVLVLGSRCI